MRSDCGQEFDAIERALIILGAESGGLEKALRQLSDFHERRHVLMLWIRKKMMYPLTTVLAACFVVPLPLLVAGQPAAYAIAAVTCSAAFLLGAEAIVAQMTARYSRQPAIARARMARALATAIEAGLTLPRAVQLAAEASDNREIQRFAATMNERDLAARSLEQSLSDCPHLTPDLLAVVATAERTGDFSVLERLADLYESGFR